MGNYYRNVVIIGLIISLGIIVATGLLKKEIVILDGEQIYHVKTLKKDMDKVFASCGIKLLESDKVAPSRETSLVDGMEIQVVRSFPVRIVIGDEVLEHHTTLLRVSAILEEAGIAVDTLDKVYPSLEQVIKGDRKIELVKVERKIVDQLTPVAYNVEMQRTEQLKSGVAQVKAEGEYGTATEQVEILVENGVITSQKINDFEYATLPTTTRLQKGKEKFLVMSDGTPYRYLKVMDMTSTAYDLSYASCGKYPGHPQYGITYLGTQARPGVVAVDPGTIALRSKLYVESLDRMPDYGFSLAEDTGSAINSNRIDLFINDNAQAMRYGIRRVRVYVLEDAFDDTLMVGYSR
ncbi:MAG: DUF348 domain-containing protein [Clostridia bacterium]|nr:DUF348 domain-containing protein [Clostridia bacterium]